MGGISSGSLFLASAYHGLMRSLKFDTARTARGGADDDAETGKSSVDVGRLSRSISGIPALTLWFRKKQLLCACRCVRRENDVPDRFYSREAPYPAGNDQIGGAVLLIFLYCKCRPLS